MKSFRVAYCWGHGPRHADGIAADLVSLQRQCPWLSVETVNTRDYLPTQRPPDWPTLDHLFKSDEPRLRALYGAVREVAATADVLLVNHDYLLHPRFVETLRGRVYSVLWASDDPDNSDNWSKPFVRSYDHVFTWGVYFDTVTTIASKFLEWGAKRTDHVPCGVRADQFMGHRTRDEVLSRSRPIPVAFVGSPYNKIRRLAEIKKGLGRDFRVYGSWGTWRQRVQTYVTTGLLPRPEAEDIVSLYQDLRIGINVHLTYGPSNMRTFQLPANGVMQICDCRDGLREWFEIGKEVVAYETPAQAVDAARYYLAHEAERLAIAAAGYDRVFRQYQHNDMFRRLLARTIAGMIDAGQSCSKSGTSLTALSENLRDVEDLATPRQIRS